MAGVKGGNKYIMNVNYQIVFGRSGLLIFLGLFLITWEEMKEKCGIYRGLLPGDFENALYVAKIDGIPNVVRK